MSYTFKTILSNGNNYGGGRKSNTIKYIVIHYTANDGDTAEANGNYFKNNTVKASAHYFVDDNKVICSVPVSYIAWSVGGAKYNDCNKTGGGKLHGVCTNANSISIELCDTKKNGKYDFTEATLANAAQLTKELMAQYNIPIENVIRHFDVNGKPCPKPFVDSEKDWLAFKARLEAEYVYATKLLPLREAGNATAKCIVKIPEKKKVRVLERPGKYWHVKVTLDGKVYKGYTNSNYLKS